VLAAAHPIVAVDPGAIVPRAAADRLAAPVARLHAVVPGAGVTGVAARATVEQIGAATAGEAVGAALPQEAIAARAADQTVVPLSSAPRLRRMVNRGR
jgi:hypothetical protein